MKKNFEKLYEHKETIMSAAKYLYIYGLGCDPFCDEEVKEAKKLLKDFFKTTDEKFIEEKLIAFGEGLVEDEELAKSFE